MISLKIKPYPSGTPLKQAAIRLLQLLMLASGTLFLSGCEEVGGVLFPKGVITFEERILLFDAVALMLIVVIPVIIMSFAFVFKYRAAHKTAEYKPNWSHSVFLEVLWWGIPIIIVVILGVLSWKSTHKLDPYRPIDGKKAELKIEVITLPWKWLFIYPDHQIATLNELVIPKGKQVEFDLTADNAAMAAFFVPQLASQIYTMAGMRTKLHMLATEEGTFRGLNAQYNGDGFSDNHFPVRVVDEKGMEAFIAKAKASQDALTLETYKAIREPSVAPEAHYYSSVVRDLFPKVIAYYMSNTSLDAKSIPQHNMHHAK